MAVKLNIASWNAQGLKRQKDIVSEVVGDYDFFIIQETWMYEYESNYCNHLHPHFYSVCNSAMKSDVILKGRPFGGLCILYHSSFSQHVKVIDTHSSHLLAIVYGNGVYKSLIVNVYFPCNTSADSDMITECIVDISSLWATVFCDRIKVAGDFNLDPKTNKHSQLHEMCLTESLRIIDVEFLSQDTLTYVSNQSGHTSWLDHFITSQNVLCSVVKVLDTVLSSDHLIISMQRQPASIEPAGARYAVITLNKGLVNGLSRVTDLSASIEN